MSHLDDSRGPKSANASSNAGKTSSGQVGAAADAGGDFANMLAEFEREQPGGGKPRSKKARGGPQVGAEVKGRVLSIGRESIFVDLGGKDEDAGREEDDAGRDDEDAARSRPLSAPRRGRPVRLLPGEHIREFHVTTTIQVEVFDGQPQDRPLYSGQLTLRADPQTFVVTPSGRGVTVTAAAFIILGNLIADLVTPLVDPRIRLR